ncbi:peptidyl-prolyl cis-trans isomerase [Gemmatimonadetes bacterium T265]|nr:peptidyl-prolyl cis-trans isomerase [Gemmatimonadetes bacterium T265]
MSFAGVGIATLVGASVGACRSITSPDQNPATVAYSDSLNIRLSEFTKDTSGVYYQDLAVGSGNQAVKGATLSYYYTGYLANGRAFGTNASSTSPLTFVLGNGEVIRGFDRGLLGIRAGGRRRLIIPPSLGYGETSHGTGIPAGSVLVFVVDVPAVTLPTTTASAAPSSTPPPT